MVVLVCLFKEVFVRPSRDVSAIFPVLVHSLQRNQHLRLQSWKVVRAIRRPWESANTFQDDLFKLLDLPLSFSHIHSLKQEMT